MTPKNNSCFAASETTQVANLSPAGFPANCVSTAKLPLKTARFRLRLFLRFNVVRSNGNLELS